MYKTNIIQLCHRNSWPEPVYSTVEEGPDNRSTFTATIIVNGASYQASEKCSSKNEAQNEAAKLAFNQLSIANPIPPLPLTEEVPPTRLPSDARHMYKIVLKNYAQKRKMGFPQYSSESEGPSLAKRYKSSVTIGGQVHESPKSYRTIKEAESAAATVACELLLENDIHEEQLCIFKPLLQDLARKRGLMLNYMTTTVDMDKFISSVEMGGRTFHGLPSISKKKAEMNAAKIAYTTTIQEYELGTNYQITPSESALDPSPNSGNLATQQAELGSQPTTTTTTLVQNQELIVTDNSAHVDHSENSLKDKLEDCLSVLKSAMNGVFNPNIPIAEVKDLEMNVEESPKDIEDKRCDTDVTINVEDQGFPEATELPNGLSFVSHPSEDQVTVNVEDPLPLAAPLSSKEATNHSFASHPSKDQVTVNLEDPLALAVPLSSKEATNNQSPASILSMTINQPSIEPFLELKALESETVTLTCDKLAIYPRVPNLTFPDDGSVVVLPFENDKWVVVGVVTKK